MYVDTDAVRWFQQVGDGMTVTEVSELERVTQSGVSRAPARLEFEAGTPLLRRSGANAADDPRRFGFQNAMWMRCCFSWTTRSRGVNQLIEPETATVSLAFE